MNRRHGFSTSQPVAAVPKLDEGSEGRAARYNWQFVIGIALRHRRTLILANLLAFAAALVSVPIPLLLPLMVDEVLLNRPGNAVDVLNQLLPQGWQGPMPYILTMLAATVWLRLGSLGFNILQTRQFTRIAKDVTYRMRRDMLSRLERISMTEYETLGSGKVTSHFVTDIDAVDEFVGTTVGRFLISVLVLIGTAAILLWMHWPLALFILCMNPVVVYLTVVLGKRVKELKRRENKAYEVFQDSLTETLDAIQQIRASNRERHYLRRVSDRARTVRDDGTAFAWKSDTANRLSFLIFLVGFDVFRGISMVLVVFSDLTVGQMMAVFGYLWFMMGPVQEILNIQYAYYGAKAALGRINQLTGLRQEPRYPHRVNPFTGNATVAVRIEQLNFAYGDTPVLNNLSLTIEPGEKVALVGASGGGKSTLVQVLVGLYSPQGGTVYFAGTPVEEIGLEVVRENVAVVLQHPALFNDTVRANLAMGREVSDEVLWNALAVAQLREYVATMPDGLDTLIGRQGVRLSGGQRQRLAIARMMLAQPKVVILDEATSALDTETEAKLHQGLRTFLAGRTTLIVAHRLSAVKQADRVYVFESGEIIEQGEHAELMRNGGLYSKLYGHYQTA